MSRNAWLTKSLIPSRADFVITLPDDEEWIADFLGALLLLGESENWEVLGGLSQGQMASEWFALFLLFATERKLSIPVGTIVLHGASGSVSGWLECDGGEVSRSQYAELYGVVGDSFGDGNGTTTFNLPNLRGRVPVGQDTSQVEFQDMGQTGGATTHVLSIAQMPIHRHTIKYNPGGVVGSPEYLLGSQNNANNIASYDGSMNNSGGGLAHNNLQPYVVVNYMIKT